MAKTTFVRSLFLTIMIYVIFNSVSLEANLKFVRSIYHFSMKVNNFNFIAEYIMIKHCGFIDSHVLVLEPSLT